MGFDHWLKRVFQAFLLLGFTAMDGIISKLEALVSNLESSGGSGAQVAKVLTQFITAK